LTAFDIELAQDLIFDHPPDRSSRKRSPLLLIVREDDIEYLPFLRSSCNWRPPQHLAKQEPSVSPIGLARMAPLTNTRSMKAQRDGSDLRNFGIV
jgi:hypothetical protein